MPKQIQSSIPKSKLVLDNPTSLKKRFGAPANKENVAPKSSVKPLAVKSISKPGESSIKNYADDGRQKRQSAYTFEGYTGENSSDSMFPPLPIIIKFATRWWFYRRYKEAWEFGPVDLYGNPRE